MNLNKIFYIIYDVLFSIFLLIILVLLLSIHVSYTLAINEPFVVEEKVGSYPDNYSWYLAKQQTKGHFAYFLINPRDERITFRDTSSTYNIGDTVNLKKVEKLIISY